MLKQVPLRQLESVTRSIRTLPHATVWHLDTRSLTIYQCVCMCVFCRVCLSGFGINTLPDVFEEDVEFIILDDMPKSSKSKKWNPFRSSALLMRKMHAVCRFLTSTFQKPAWSDQNAWFWYQNCTEPTYSKRQEQCFRIFSFIFILFHTISCLLVHCKVSSSILQTKSFFVKYPFVIKCGPAERGQHILISSCLEHVFMYLFTWMIYLH